MIYRVNVTMEVVVKCLTQGEEIQRVRVVRGLPKGATCIRAEIVRSGDWEFLFHVNTGPEGEGVVEEFRPRFQTIYAKEEKL